MDPVGFPSSRAAVAIEPTRVATTSATAGSEAAATEVAATPGQAAAVENAIPAAIAEMAARLAAQNQILSAALASGGLNAALQLLGGNDSDPLQANLLTLFGPNATDKSPLQSGTLAQTLGQDFFEAVTGQAKAFNAPLLGESRVLAERLLSRSTPPPTEVSEADPAPILARLSSLLAGDSKPESSLPGIRSFLIASLQGELLSSTAGSVQIVPARNPLKPNPIRASTPAEPVAGESSKARASDPVQRILGQLDSLEEFARTLAAESTGESKSLLRLQEAVVQLRQALTGNPNETVVANPAQIAISPEDPKVIEFRAALERGLTFEFDLPGSERTDLLLKALEDHGVQVERTPGGKTDQAHVRLTIGGEKELNRNPVDSIRESKPDTGNPEKHARLDPKTEAPAEKAPVSHNNADPVAARDRSGEPLFSRAQESPGREQSIRRGIEEFLRSDINPHHKFDIPIPGFALLTAFYAIHREAFAGDREFSPATEPGVRRLLLEYKPVEIIEPGAESLYFAPDEAREIVDVELERV